MMNKLSVMFAVAMLAACGGGGGTGPVSHDQAQSGCTQGCEYDHMCDSTVDVAMCTDDCVAAVEGNYREDVFEALLDCGTALACDATDDTCFEDSCSPTSAHESYETACRAKVAECNPDATPDQIDGTCETTPDASGNGFLCAFVPSMMDELTACFDIADCQMAQDCLNQVFTDHGLG